jgi:predicted RNA-binding Zn-ribbon protein involved in translation (DUF1610 family)
VVKEELRMAIREFVIYRCDRCGFEQGYQNTKEIHYATSNDGWAEYAIPVEESSFPKGTTKINLYKKLMCPRCAAKIKSFHTDFHKNVMEWYCSEEGNGDE